MAITTVTITSQVSNIKFPLLFIVFLNCSTQVHSEIDFPLKKLFLDADDNFISQYKLRHTCGKNMTPGWQCCSCDPTCQAYGDCCVDYQWQRHNGSFSSMEEYKDFLIKESRTKKNKNFGCFHAADPFMSNEYWMITKCSSSYTEEDREEDSCWNSRYLSVEESLVVLGDDGFLYTNAYCASCNGVKSYQIVQFKTECVSEKSPFSSCFISLNLSRSTWIYEHDHQLQRWPLKLCESFLKRCNEKNGKDYELCSSFQGPVVKNNNPFCLDCQDRHFAKTNLKDDYFCKNWDWKKGKGPIKFSYTTTLEYEDLVTAKTCQETRGTDFADIIHGECSTIACQRGYKSFKSKCYQFEHLYSNGLNINSFDQDLAQTLKYLTIYDKNITKKNLTDLTSHLGEILSMNSYDANTIEIELKFISNETINNLTAYVVTNHYVFTENSSYILSPHSLVLDTLLFNAEQVFPGRRLCAELKPMPNDSVVSERKYELEYKNFTYWIEFRGGFIGKYVRECQRYFPVCQFHVLEANTTLIDGGTLINIKNDLSIKKSYISAHGGFVICEDEEPRPWYFFILSFKNYPLLIGLFSSCLCVMVVVTSYSIRRALRSSRRMNLQFIFRNEEAD